VEAGRTADDTRWHVTEWAPPPPADTWVQTEWSYVRWSRAPTARMAAAFPHDAALQATLSATTEVEAAAAAALAPSRVRQEGLTKVSATSHSVLTPHNKPVLTTLYSPGSTTAHSVLTALNTPVPTTPCSPGGGTTASVY
jgi:hypothetical protein